MNCPSGICLWHRVPARQCHAAHTKEPSTWSGPQGPAQPSECPENGWPGTCWPPLKNRRTDDRFGVPGLSSLARQVFVRGSHPLQPEKENPGRRLWCSKNQPPCVPTELSMCVALRATEGRGSRVTRASRALGTSCPHGHQAWVRLRAYFFSSWYFRN